MRHSTCMASLGDLEDCPTVNANGFVTLLVKQAGSATADAIARGLRAAGLPLLIVTAPYDAVTEAARTNVPVRHLVVGVDYFDAEAFRLLPLFRREWPTTTIVAYHSPGFEHKGRVAGLVGADVVLSRPAEVLAFLGTLAAHEDRPRAPRPHPAWSAEAAAPAPQPADQAIARVAPSAAASPASETAEAARPAVPSQPPEAEAAAREPSPPEPEPVVEDEAPPLPSTAEEIENLDRDRELATGRVIGTVELTDEELRILLGEENDT